MTTTYLLIALIIVLIPVEITLAQKKVYFRFTLFALAFVIQIAAVLFLCIKHA